MKFIIGKINGLSIEEDINKNNIFTHLSYFDPTLDVIKRCIGDLRFDLLQRNPAFVMLNNESDDFKVPDTIEINQIEQKELYQIFSNLNSLLQVGLWLLKDSAVTCVFIYKFKQNTGDMYSHEGKFGITCSDGSSPIIHFTSQEFEVAYDYLCELNKLSKGFEYSLYKVENNFVTSLSSLVPHNSIDKITSVRRFLGSARKSSNILEKISWYIVALETLYKFNDKVDLQFKLSYRVPHFLTNDAIDAEILYNAVKDGYELRSNFLHGGYIEKKILKEKEKQIEISQQLDDILRRTFLLIIQDENKFNILTKPEVFKEFFHKKFIGY